MSAKFDWLQVNFGHTRKKGYIHLLALLKKRKDAFLFVSDQLELLAPEIHERIIFECRSSGISPFFEYFQLYNVKNKTDYIFDDFKRTIHFYELINKENKLNSQITLEQLYELLNEIEQEENRIISRQLFCFEKNKLLLQTQLFNNRETFHRKRLSQINSVLNKLNHRSKPILTPLFTLQNVLQRKGIPLAL